MNGAVRDERETLDGELVAKNSAIQHVSEENFLFFVEYHCSSPHSGLQNRDAAPGSSARP